jgi:hypothetical protein
VRAVHLVPAGVVLLALGAIGAAASLDRPTASPNPAAVTRQATVTAAARACPPTLGGGTGTVALIAAPAGSAGSGQVELASLSPAGVQLQPAGVISAKGPGVLSLLTVPTASTASTAVTKAKSSKGQGSKGQGSKGQGSKATPVPTGWSVTASGTMAQAIEAEVASSSGLASLRCGEPGSDIWFVGPGQQNGAAQIQLELMNIDSLAATVDISMITDAGPVQAGNETGITVPPHETVTESLSPAAGNSSVVAIEVHTSSGRVAADVSEGGSAHGSTTSWLPSAAEPSAQLVIPGVPPSSHAELFLAVPGTADAKVNVLAITPQGPYRPFGSQSVDLPGQSASSMALTPLGGSAAAIEITANVPVTATVLVPGSGVGAFTTATGPISEQAVVAGNISGSGFTASIVLSAPAGAARVRLTEISAPAGSAGSRASQVISVRAGRTLMVPVTAPSGAKRGVAFAVVITPLPGAGPLYAARVETQGQNTVVSIIPAASALTTISLPPVRDSYDAIYPLAETPAENPSRKPQPKTPAETLAELAVAGIDDLRLDAEDLGELLDHHVEDELAQVVIVLGPGQQRLPEQHDARSGGWVPRVSDIGRAPDDPGQRHAVFIGGIEVRHFLDREFHVGQLGLPARLEPGHGLEHQVVELLGPAPVQRNVRRYQPAAQPAPVPVTSPRPGARDSRARDSRARDSRARDSRARDSRARDGCARKPPPWPRAVLAGLHSHRAYRIARSWPTRGQRTRRAKHDTTRRRARVVAFGPADRYRHGCIRHRPSSGMRSPG